MTAHTTHTDIVYPQGFSLPPAARGAGNFFLALAVVLLIFFPEDAWVISLLMLIPGVLLSFSKATLIVRDGAVYKRSGIGPISTTSLVDLAPYRYGVIRKVQGSYRLIRISGFMEPDRVAAESFTGLYLMRQARGEKKLLIKGSKAQILDFIKATELQGKVEVYHGVVKAGYEL